VGRAGRLLAAAALAGACRGATARDSSSGAPVTSASAAPASGDVPWTLVYDQVVDGNQDVYAVPAAGGLPRRLTDDPGHDMLPRFTHDGRSILFASDRTGRWQIWEMPAAGGPARRVRENAFVEYQVDESADGRFLAFLSNQEGRESLFVMPRAGGAARELVRHGPHTIMGNPDWSPDGTRIAFSSNWRLGHQVYVVEVKSGRTERLSPLRRGGCEPRFSPDGRRVIYVDRGHLGETSLLTEVDLGSGERRTIVDWPALNYDPAYSPDASEIAFASNVTGEYAIYRQRLADRRSWRVTQAKGEARDPDYR
jgi:Tol biopolymer transport system component